MDISTLKKAAFFAGIFVFLIVVLGYLKGNDFYFDADLFCFYGGRRCIPFSFLSLFASALMVFGMKTTDTITTLKRCKTGAIIGGFFWVWIIVALFVCDDYDSSFFANWLLLCASATALIYFAIKYTMKKEA